MVCVRVCVRVCTCVRVHSERVCVCVSVRVCCPISPFAKRHPRGSATIALLYVQVLESLGPDDAAGTAAALPTVSELRRSALLHLVRLLEIYLLGARGQGQLFHPPSTKCPRIFPPPIHQVSPGLVIYGCSVDTPFYTRKHRLSSPPFLFSPPPSLLPPITLGEGRVQELVFTVAFKSLYGLGCVVHPSARNVPGCSCHV